MTNTREENAAELAREEESIYQCPACGARENFTIQAVQSMTCYVTASAEVYDSESHDIEWGNTSTMECRECQHVATVKDFTISDPQGELCRAYAEHLQNEIKQARKES